MANLITVGRLLLLFVVVAMIYRGGGAITVTAMVLIVVVFAGDGLDGYVARRRNSTSQFGAVFDIAGDRVVEQVLWIVFAHVGTVGVWVPLLIITRGSIVDALRSLSYADGMTAFGSRNMMRSSVTQWLTAGRFMRALYGYAKAAGFVFLAGEVQFGDAADSTMGALYDAAAFRALGWFTVWLAVALSVVRGLPVIYDALAYLQRPARLDTAASVGARPVDAPGSTGGRA